VLINITGGYDLTLFELDEAANRIREEVDPDANIIVGSTLDDRHGRPMRVSVVATGIDGRRARPGLSPRRRHGRSRRRPPPSQCSTPPVGRIAVSSRPRRRLPVPDAGSAGASERRDPARRPASRARTGASGRSMMPRSPSRTRFGINNLINRMTGHGEEAPRRWRGARRASRARRRRATSRPDEDDGSVDPDQERIEIPAFLRRQAN
jgi:cell division protein FtsZ